jgi:hypothetical protein
VNVVIGGDSFGMRNPDVDGIFLDDIAGLGTELPGLLDDLKWSAQEVRLFRQEPTFSKYPLVTKSHCTLESCTHSSDDPHADREWRQARVQMSTEQMRKILDCVHAKSCV